MEKNDIYKTSRLLYIAEAALEYFISLLVTGAYLAKLTDAIGLSDSLTGILTSFVSLGCGFQLFAIFLMGKSRVKPIVTLLHTLNQLFFALIYFVPFFKISDGAKTILFIVFLLLGHVLNNVINAPKINWFMSLVDDNKRGRFTANKEIVSLVGGMIFSFCMGKIIDKFEANGNLNGAFIVCGVSVFVLMVLHGATLIYSKEKPRSEISNETNEKGGHIKKEFVNMLKDKNLLKIVFVSVLWNMANYASTPFYGSYQIKELGFSMTFVSVLSIAYSIVRSLCSNPLGKYADKHSFSSMLNICFAVMIVAFGINVFTIPSNGKILYTVYYILYACAMAGINSATINLIYDYVDENNRMGALALNSTLSGFAGFFTTLAIGFLVSKIQNDGNTLFGMNVYAQQIVSVISVIILLLLFVYMNMVVKNIKRQTKNSENETE